MNDAYQIDWVGEDKREIRLSFRHTDGTLAGVKTWWSEWFYGELPNFDHPDVVKAIVADKKWRGYD